MTAVFAWHGGDLPYEDVVYNRAAFLEAIESPYAAIARRALAVLDSASGDDE